MIIRTVKLTCIVWSMVCCVAVHAEDSIDATRKRMIGLWEATPTYELEFLRAKPQLDEIYTRAQALGARVSYRLANDGSLKITRLWRSGNQDGTDLGKLVATTVTGKWEVIAGEKNVVVLRLLPQQGKPVEIPIQTIDRNELVLNCPEFAGTPFRQPFHFRRQVGEQAYKWLLANLAVSKDSDIIEDLTKLIIQCVREQKDFTLRIGADLLKSGTPTQLDGYAEQFFVTELDDSLAREIGLNNQGVSTVTTPRPQTFPALNGAIIKDLKVEQDGEIDLAQAITGSVDVNTNDYSLREGGASGMNYAIHFRLLMGKTARDYYINLNQDTHAGPTPFSFKTGANAADYHGPLVLFADVCVKFKLQDGSEAVQIVSRSLKFPCRAMKKK